MGWSFTKNASKSDVIKDRTQNWENEKYSVICLRHTCVGSVLWTVWERTDKTTNQKERYIGCDLFQKQKGYGYGYKDLEESSQPYYYSCPLSYLNMVPVASPEWREKVREYHNQKTRKFKIGTTYSIVGITSSGIPNVKILNLKPLIGEFQGTCYKMSKSYLGDEIYAEI